MDLLIQPNRFVINMQHHRRCANFLMIVFIIMNIPNLVVMSDLLPPPASITAYIDGNPNMGKSIYLSYLADKGREQSVVNILQVLYKIYIY